MDVEDHSLGAMQKVVAGSIQMLARKKDMHVYCNEEGMPQGLNPSAYIPDFLRHLGFVGYIPEMVFGNAVITGKDKKLTTAQIEAVKVAYQVWYAKIHEEDHFEEEEEVVIVDEPSPKKAKESDDKE